MASHQSRKQAGVCRGHPHHRRGAVAAQVAVGMAVLMGFSALVIDMGMLYNTRTELQRAADSAALSAASKLSGAASFDVIRQAAQEAANRNRVLNAPVLLDESDVVLGRASLPVSGEKYSFTPTQEFPNAVRVRLRRTANSPSGPVPLFFANIFGRSRADVSAHATALLTPRDIVFVLDLSSSHNDDSSLRAYKKTVIDNDEVWRYLKDPLGPRTDGLGFTSQVNVTSNGDGTSTVTIQLTSDGSTSTAALSHVTFGLPPGAQAMAAATAMSSGGYPVEVGTDPTTGVNGLKFDETSLGENGKVETDTFQFTIPDEYLRDMVVGTKAGKKVDVSVRHNLAPGPTFGNMNTWGDAVTGPGWQFASDPGLVRLPRSSSWSLSSAYVSQTLQANGYQPYTTAEMSAINSSQYDGTTADYRRRVMVALGLARWKSGKKGGQAGGNGDNRIDANELELLVPYPNQSSNPVSGSKKVGGSWEAYIDYVSNSNSSMNRYDGKEYFGDPGLRYRFGLKTWIDYLQEMEEGTSSSPGLNGAPTQPMGAVADAVQACLNIIDELEGDDLVGLASYGTVGYGPQEKPNHMSWLVDDVSVLRDRVSVLQAGMWSSNTNVAQGIDRGVEVLFDSPAARPNAAKVMVLLTDGIANQTRGNPTSSNQTRAAQDARQAALDARARGVRIHTVSVGVNAQTELMDDIAQIGGGEHNHAEGSIDQYEQELRRIFEDLGSKRQVVLIE